MDLTYRIANPADAMKFSPFLRNEDVVEVRRLCAGRCPREVLQQSVVNSDEAYLVTNQRGAFVAMGGVGSTAYGGVPWLLCTPLLDQHRKSMLRLARKAIALWLPRYGRLWNVMDPDNLPARAFVGALGFTLHQHHWALPGGFMALPFSLEHSECVTSPPPSPSAGQPSTT